MRNEGEGALKSVCAPRSRRLGVGFVGAMAGWASSTFGDVQSADQEDQLAALEAKAIAYERSAVEEKMAFAAEVERQAAAAAPPQILKPTLPLPPKPNQKPKPLLPSFVQRKRKPAEGEVHPDSSGKGGPTGAAATAGGAAADGALGKRPKQGNEPNQEDAPAGLKDAAAGRSASASGASGTYTGASPGSALAAAAGSPPAASGALLALAAYDESEEEEEDS